MSDCTTKLSKPFRHWSSTVGNVRLTRLNNFRIRLLVGCDGLEKDAARFRSRRQPDVEVGDAVCKVCGNSTEDALHFISFCPALATARTNLLRAAPGSISSLLLDPVTRPIQFADHMLGTCDGS